jgi:hypothetical protein
MTSQIDITSDMEIEKHVAFIGQSLQKIKETLAEQSVFDEV